MATATRKTSPARALTAEALTAEDLLRMSPEALDDLFRASEAGPTPSGVGEGTPIVAPGTPIAAPLTLLLRLAWRGKVFRLAWRGQVFDRARGELCNRIGPLGVQAVRAAVRREASWLDGRTAIVLDYSRSWLPFRPIRDEIRLVAPGLYLGVVWWRRTETVHFALTFR